MEIELNKLTNIFEIDEDFTFAPEKYSYQNFENLQNMHVKGTIKYNAADNLEVNLHVTGLMTLKDSITLELINHNLDFEIAEEYDPNAPDFKEYYEKEQNILDIMAILWENIVLEVPIRLTNSPDAKLEGDGWALGDCENKKDNIDPRLAKLAEVLAEGKE